MRDHIPEFVWNGLVVNAAMKHLSLQRVLRDHILQRVYHLVDGLSGNKADIFTFYHGRVGKDFEADVVHR